MSGQIELIENRLFPERFQNVRLIAKGTFSNVFSARDMNLERDIAIKAIPDVLDSNGELGDKLGLEIQVLSKLHHPGIIRLLDVSKIQGYTLLIQPLCAKGTLDQEQNWNALSNSRRLSIIDTLLQATQYVHDQGWIHCDLKPSNLLLDDRGAVFLSDFGEACQIALSSKVGKPVGSIGYMAPELLKGKSGASVQTDVYSIGVTLYELLTGSRAFPEDAMNAIQTSISNGVPAIKKSVPSAADWNAVVQKATCLDVRRRYRSVQELATDVQQIRENKSIAIRRVSAFEHLCKWMRKEPITAGLALSVIAVTILGATGVGVAWLDVSRQLTLSQTNEAELVRLSEQSIAAKTHLEKSLSLANNASANAKRSEEEAQEAINSIAVLNEKLDNEAQEAERLNSELLASVQSIEENQQKKIAIDQKSLAISKSASQAQAEEYWRLINLANSHHQSAEYELAIEALNSTPQNLRRAEYALLRGLVEIRSRIPVRTEIGSIEFDEKDDSIKEVSVTGDGRIFARCSYDDLKILEIETGKLSSFKLPKFRGAAQIWLQFNEESTKLMVAITSESQGRSYALENRNNSWSFSGNPISTDGPCFGLTQFFGERAFLVCKKEAESDTLQFVDANTGLIACSYVFDSKITNADFVRCGWLPNGNHVLILNNRRILLFVDDGTKLTSHLTSLPSTKKLLSADVSFFTGNARTSSLRQQLLPNQSVGVSGFTTDRDKIRSAFNMLRGRSHRLVESFSRAFSNSSLLDRSAWVWGNDSNSYFVLNGFDGNVAILLSNARESCFPLEFSNNGDLYAVFYPEPTKVNLFNRNSPQLPKAVLLKYDFTAKEFDQLRVGTSPFQNKNPLELLTSRESPAAPNAEIDFIAETEEPLQTNIRKSIEYRCFDPDGNLVRSQKVHVGEAVTVAIPSVTNGTKYRIELRAGQGFDVLKTDVELAPGKITDLGRLKLKTRIANDSIESTLFNVFGVIKDSSGKGIADAKVNFGWMKRQDRISHSTLTTLTDRDGNYRAEGIGSRDCYFSVSRNGFIAASADLRKVALSKNLDNHQPSPTELESNLVLSSSKLIKLKYVISGSQSESFVGQKIEKGTAEVAVENLLNSFQDSKESQKNFTDFVRKNNLRISFDGAGVKLIGRCPISTAEETDFDAITEVGTFSNADAFFVPGKILLIRGFTPEQKKTKNQSNYCVKILVESVTE